MSGPKPLTMLIALALIAGATALIVAATGSAILGLCAGLIVAVIAVFVTRDRLDAGGVPNPSRRHFLVWTGLSAAGLAVLGAAAGRSIARALRPDPEPVLRAYGHELGSNAVELMRKGNYPDRSGDLQLVLQPFNSSNYAQESLTLVNGDPRTSHSLVWDYTQRVPIAVYAPGVVSAGGSNADPVDLTDLAPTAAHIMGHEHPGFDGSPLPEIEAPASPPKLIVTFVIDGGGWNVLDHWGPEYWPHLARLMRDGTTYTNAITGSFPSVTACAHATIGTGVYPRTHGISGHNVRIDDHVHKAYGKPGEADPTYMLAPTLADTWSEASDHKAWIGQFGFQIWHLGMIGKGGTRPLGDKPVAVYWNEDAAEWASQNPDLYRLPNDVPSLENFRATFERWKRDHPADFKQVGFVERQFVCCSPPAIEYEGEMIRATIESENVGGHAATDLLYINYKSPDYTGHIYNMLAPQEGVALAAVDAELGKLRALLESRFAPGEYVLIVTADHGQCPLPNTEGGVRVDPIQLGNDIEAEFGGQTPFPIVKEVEPSEVFLDRRGLADSGVRPQEVAAWLRDYTYAENLGPYIKSVARQPGQLRRRDFSAVMPSDWMLALDQATVASFGEGAVTDGDTGPGTVPPEPAGGG